MEITLDRPEGWKAGLWNTENSTRQKAWNDLWDKTVNNILKYTLRKTGHHCRDFQARLGPFIPKTFGDSTILGNMMTGSTTHNLLHYTEPGAITWSKEEPHSAQRRSWWQPLILCSSLPSGVADEVCVHYPKGRCATYSLETSTEDHKIEQLLSWQGSWSWENREGLGLYQCGLVLLFLSPSVSLHPLLGPGAGKRDP